MKKIEAIIRPEKLDEVRAALERSGYPGITITGVEGHGLQKGIVQQWRGEEYRVDILPKVKIEIVVGDEEAETIVQAILESAYTGGVGDGKVFIYDVAEAVRIRTRERGVRALA
ncbi:MAG: transcriptional regulator [Candidatus Wildermuthbacteria bacterium RIFCSPHIGHO2_02_FULL_47_12]|uniref:Transcriptional regulator n=1 Tax=Candidatus Wildermuthbacteria bacterium RIFCSPHIGHO2_02_FULL_47_12 TaxID=1802451 RepID=A0A1G2R3Z0_9BACT|nr:MAG: transcriptional regulator [Candidatus Wildermuthbacteria bacterium RIFCSPHIGHO2_02_FULL_47_12]